MNINWDHLSMKDRDKLISRELLKFTCFKDTSGEAWYDKYYKMGFWHYTSDIKATFQLIDKITSIDNSIELELIKKESTYLIRVISDKNNSIIGYYESSCLPDLICKVLAIHYKII